MLSINRISLIGLVCLFASSMAMAQDAWVSDQFEVMLRTGPSTSNAIERMLPSGTSLEILETNAEAGYSRVQTAAGTEGWVLSRYLMNEPSAREQLRRLTGQLNSATDAGSSLTSQLDAVKGQYATASNRISALEREKKALQEELADIKRTAANVLSIDSQNKDLREQLAMTEIEVGTLEQQNRELSGQSTRQWFLTGALVIGVGIILGLWLPRIRWRRRSGYDRF
ncbi:MAG: TIGR04211 family SH3 domain-containing protein [Woeseiaceae bacterium]